MTRSTVTPPLSDAVQRIQPSPTLAISQKAHALQAEGADIISLAAGEPDFDTPEHIKQAAIKAIKDGHTKYTTVDGMEPLKQAVAKKFSEDNHLNFSPQEISIAPGGKAILYNALMATLNPGDEVVFPAPYWVSYPAMTLLAGGRPKPVPTSSKTGFKLKPEALEAALTPKTKWFIFNTPSNPTGVAYTEEELQELARVLETNPHVWIMTDDLYEHIIYGGFPFKTLAALAPHLQERLLTVNGVSKAYAMTGWRIGYAGGPQSLIRAMAKIMSQSTSNACSVAQWAALEALSGPQNERRAFRSVFETRRNLALKALQACEGLACPEPQGAFYLYPDCSELMGKTTPEGRFLKTDLDLASALLEEENLAVVPGAAFGSSPAFRLSYALDTKELGRACERLRNFCARLT